MGKNLCECFGHSKTPSTLNFHVEKEYKFLFEKSQYHSQLLCDEAQLWITFTGND